MNDYTVYMHISPSNKRYIGITHLKPTYRYGKNGNGYKRCTVFYRAIQKYGWDNFEHIILYSELSKEDACNKEQELISEYKTNNPKYGYNCSLGGESGSYGYKPTPEVRAKISAANKGRTVSAETRRKIGLANSVALKGRTVPDEVRQKISEHNGRGFLGKHHTEETRRKNSEAHIGKKYHLGYKHSEEAKQKMRMAKLGKKRGPWTDAERQAHMDAIRRKQEEKTKHQII